MRAGRTGNIARCKGSAPFTIEVVTRLELEANLVIFAREAMGALAHQTRILPQTALKASFA
jgi:hypothetical protein